jgi:hypothetical protein
LEPRTVPRGALWVEGVNAPTAGIDVDMVRESVPRDRPFGSSVWAWATAQALGLEYSLRQRGRPLSDGTEGGETTQITQATS